MRPSPGPVTPDDADWLAGVPFEQLVTFGPAGFAAYARVRFVPDPGWPGQQEADIELPEDHPSDLAQARRALHVLAAHTATPDDCFFCLWEGYPYELPPAQVLPTARVVVPHRAYAVFRAPLAAVDTLARAVGGGREVAPPAFVWPADRRWCFAADVDPTWAGVGGDRAAVDALLAARGLDVVAADPAQPQPRYA